MSLITLIFGFLPGLNFVAARCSTNSTHCKDLVKVSLQDATTNAHPTAPTHVLDQPQLILLNLQPLLIQIRHPIDMLLRPSLPDPLLPLRLQLLQRHAVQ